MSKSRIVPLLIKVRGGTLSGTFEWRNKDYGKPSTANIEKYVVAGCKSLGKNGANYHIGKEHGISTPSSAEIIRQRTGEVLAKWKAPVFWVI